MSLFVYNRRALWALGCGLAIAGSAAADQSLLGVCSESSSAQCSTTTAWSLAETAIPSQLNNPENAPAAFEIAVTEGASTRTLSLTDRLTLDGLLQSGTDVTAIFLTLQKSDGAGGYTSVASAVIGDPSNACGCPYVASSMTLTAQGSGGSSISGSPLLSLASGDQEVVDLNASWEMSAGLVNPGDVLRVQSCFAYKQGGISLPAGCYASGGSVHAVKACSPIALSPCPAQPATLTETLSSLSNNVATLSSFTASSSSPSISPPSLLQTPGGAAIVFAATPTGVAGTQSVVNVQGQVSCAGVGTSMFDDVASIATANASAAINLNCLGNGWSCASLGPAAPYNVFLTQGISATNSDIEGSLAAAGNVTLSNYGVGKSMNGPNPLALVAGGNLNLASAWIFGDAWVGGTSSLSLAGYSGSLNQGIPLNFATAGTELSALSNQLEGLAPRGTVTVSGGAGAVLTGTDPVLDVFNLSAATLASTWGISLSVPPSAFAVLNVSGASAQFSDLAFSTGGLPPQQLIINVPQANALTLDGIGLVGTVLAPQASVQFNNGVVEGAIIASSFTGDGQTNLAPQVACIPIPAGSGGGTGGGSAGGSGGGSGSAGGSGGGSAGGPGSCTALEAAAPYSVFVKNGYTGSSSDVQGAIAAGGNVTLSSYTVGSLLDDQPGTLALAAGGNVSFAVGGNVDGDLEYGGTAMIANQVTISGNKKQGMPIDFAATFTLLGTLSQQFAGAVANGTWAVQYGNVTLTGTDPALNVFDLPASTLTGQWGITLAVPPGSFAVVNLTGASATLQHTIELNGLPSQNLLFNFPQATSVTIQQTQLTGSVLAPSAAIVFNSGVVDGSLIGSSFSGGGQTNLPLLNPCILTPASGSGR